MENLYSYNHLKGNSHFPKQFALRALGLSVLLFILFARMNTVIGQTVMTDKIDYVPGEYVMVTGTGWTPGETVRLHFEKVPPVSLPFDINVVADQTGSIMNNDYVVQLIDLDVTFTLTATGLSSGKTASTIFTDAPGTISKVYQHWADQAPAEWNNNILSANKSDYFEGEVIPHVFVYKASKNSPLTNGSSYSFNITYNYYQQNTNTGGFAFITTFNISRNPGPLNATNPYITPTVDGSFTNGGGMQGDFYTVDANITNVSAVTYLGSGTKDGYVTVTFTYTGVTTTNGLAEIYYGLYIAEPGMIPDQGAGMTKGAHGWTGGSLQTTVDIGGSGATSIQLSPDAIIVGQIDGVKYLDVNRNGVKDAGETLLSGWTIYIDANNNNVFDPGEESAITDANGYFTFSVIPKTDPYIIREVLQSNYTQTQPSSGYYSVLITTSDPTETIAFGNYYCTAPSCSIDRSPLGNLCPGTTVTLTAPSGTGLHYLWTLPSGVTFASGSSASDRIVNVIMPLNATCGQAYSIGLKIFFDEFCYSSCSISLTVNDIIDPVITGTLQDVTKEGCTTADAPAALTTVAALEALGLQISDNCTSDGNLAVTHNDVAAGSCPIVITRTYTVTDKCDNTATVTQVIKINDTTLPVIADKDDIILEGCNPDWPVVETTWTDNCNAKGATIQGVPGDITTNGCNQYRDYTFNVKDACDNSALPVLIRVTRHHDETAPQFMKCPTAPVDLGCNPSSLPTEAMALAAAGTATDDCDTELAMKAVGAAITGTCVKTQVWTITADADCGPDATCLVTYTWTADTQAPVFTACPTVPIDLGCNPANLPTEAMALAAAGRATDNCDTDLTLSATPGAITGTCVKTQVWTITADADCGPDATCLVTYTWTADTQAPVFTACPTVPIDLGCNPADLPTEAMALAAAGRATDNCDTDLKLSAIGDIITGHCRKAQVWTVTAEADCGPNATCEVTFLWTADTEIPVISTTAKSGNLGCNPNVVAPVFTGHDNCRGVFEPVVTTEGPSHQGCAYTQTWRANYTDNCKNAATEVVITYTWTVDVTPPTASNPAPIVVEMCNAAFPPVDINVVTDERDECGTPIVAFVRESLPVVTGCTETITRVYSVTDGCMNTMNVTQTLSRTVDTQKPVISTASESRHLGCNPDVVAPVFTGLDNCAGVFEPVVTTRGPVTKGCLYSQTWYANYTDPCGNVAEQLMISYTWTVDTEKPVISTTAKSGDLGCNPNITAPVFTGLDNCAGVFEPVVTTEGPVHQGCAYTQTWRANYTDNCKNAATEVVITYTWTVDVTPPTASNPAPIVVEMCNAAFPPVDINVVTDERDECGTPIVAFVRESLPVVTGCTETITRVYSVTDGCMNTMNVTQTLSRTVDTQKPVISTTSESRDLGCNPDVVAPVFTGLDNCAGVFEPVVTTRGPVTKGCLYSQTWYANYTDPCGNVAEQLMISYTWTVDTEKPVISTTAKSGDLGCNPDITAPVFTGLDNCAGVFEPVVTTEGPVHQGCAYTQTWRANYTDNCKNAATEVVITYTWTVDVTKPEITGTELIRIPACNADISVVPAGFSSLGPVFRCTSVGMTKYFVPPVPSDNCGTPVLKSGYPVTGDVETNGCSASQKRTWIYVDACNNESEPFVQTLLWANDKVKPIVTGITVIPDLGCNPADRSGAFVTPSVSDNCSTPVLKSGYPVTSDITSNGCARSKTRTWIYVDACGNESVPFVQMLTWTVDEVKPVVTGLTVIPDLGCNPADISGSFVEPKASDNCGVPLLKAGYPVTSPITFNGCNRTKTRTWIYVDACGNESDPFVQKLSWTIDITKPVVTGLSVLPDLGCNPPDISGSFIDPKVTDNCGIPVLKQGYPVTSAITFNGCNRSKTRTWIYVDACGNESDPFVQRINWTIDVTAPQIVASGTYTFGSCESVKIRLPYATDNCGGNLPVKASIDGVTIDLATYSFRPGTTNITLTAQDGCGNKSSKMAVVTVEAGPEGMILKPDFSNPVCGEFESNILKATATGSAPLTYKWSVTGTGWSIAGPDNMSEIRFGASTTQGTFMLKVTDKFGCTDVETFTMNPCMSESFCTYTQGFFGNKNGQACDGAGKSTTAQPMMIKSFGSLSSVVFGAQSGQSGNAFLLKLADITGSDPNIFRMLPGGGTPASLKGNATYSNPDSWSAVPLSTKKGTYGKICNSLLSQTMTVFFNMSNDPDLKNLRIGGRFMVTADAEKCGSEITAPYSSWYVEFPACVLKYLGTNNKVSDVYNLANLVLSGKSVSGITPSDMCAALDALNRGFDECRVLIGFFGSTDFGKINPVPAPSENLASEYDGKNDEGSLRKNEADIVAYPNPFAEQIKFMIMPNIDTPVKLEIYSTSGVLIEVLYEGDLLKGNVISVEFNSSKYPHSAFIYKLSTRSRQSGGTLLKVK